MKKNKKSFNKFCNKKVVTTQSILLILGVAVLFLLVFVSIIFYRDGQKEGINQYKKDLASIDYQHNLDLLAKQPVSVVYNEFLKILMLKVLDWIDIIIILLILGWVLHGF